MSAIPRDETVYNYCPAWCESYDGHDHHHGGDHARAIGSTDGEPGDFPGMIAVGLVIPERTAAVRHERRGRVEVNTMSDGEPVWSFSPGQARSLARLLTLAADVAEVTGHALPLIGGDLR